MSRYTKLTAFLLALVMLFALAACGILPAAVQPAEEEPAAEAPAEEPDEEPGEEPGPISADDTPLIVGCAPFSGEFSPFFSRSDDMDVCMMTQIRLIGTDRAGAYIYNGIEGETVDYNGESYTYYGPADLDVDILENRSYVVDEETGEEKTPVDFDITLRDDLVFSDGEPVTIDDVIFSMYVLADPSYDGPSRFGSLPVEGMAEYRAGFELLKDAIYNAGRDNDDFTAFTEEQQTSFWEAYDAAVLGLAEEIVAYCVENGYSEEGDITGAAESWGYDISRNSTIEDFAEAMSDAYGSDVEGMIAAASAGSTVEELFPGLDAYTRIAVRTGESASGITGIQKTGDYTMTIRMTEIDTAAIQQLAVFIAPMHYYGDAGLYDYDSDSFGFPKGDLSIVREKTKEPMGAGPYKLVRYENGVVCFEANESYYKGAPKTGNVWFRELLTDQALFSGIVNGTIDIGSPAFTAENIDVIRQTNGNGELTGDVFAASVFEDPDYDYIGMNALNVSVDDDPASYESKALRKAFATVFSVYRGAATDAYYGDRAVVIDYPFSNISWAVPRPADKAYREAFSTDIDDDDIYTDSMTEEERYAAALRVALEWFEEAGYTVENGVLTEAPEGAKLEYTVWILGNGVGDDPAYLIVNAARKALESIGMTLTVYDLDDPDELKEGLDALEVEMWTGRRVGAVDPDTDLYQSCFSDFANGPIEEDGMDPLGGPDQGASNFESCIADVKLDQAIQNARNSFDRTYRKSMYKTCLDIIADWAVEVPTCQCLNAVLFSSDRVDTDTVTPDITDAYGWMAEIENTCLK